MIVILCYTIDGSKQGKNKEVVGYLYSLYSVSILAILCGRTFSSRSALATAIFQWSQCTPKEAFAVAIQSWRQRCEKCVRLQGDYVEKLLHFQLSRMSNFVKNKLGDLRA